MRRVALAVILSLILVSGVGAGEIFSITGTFTRVDTHDLGSSEPSPAIEGIEFADDGTKFYAIGEVIDGDSDMVFYDLSDPYNLSSRTQNSADLIGAFRGDPNIKPDGTRLVVSDRNADNLIQWDLTEAYNTSTRTNQVTESVSGSYDIGLFITDDGDRMYTGGSGGIRQYSLSDPWNISSASVVRTNSTPGGSIAAILVVDDGQTMIISDSDADVIEEYSMSDPYNISTLSLEGSQSEGNVWGMQFNGDGNRLFTIALTTDTVNEYNLADNNVSGFVKDTDGNGISGATVTINDTSQTDTTGADGSYEVFLANGTYNITASHADFNEETITITVNGSDLTNQNITLTDEELTIDVAKAYMAHGSTQDYTVLLGTTDVTDQSTVVSSNTSVVTVDESARTLTATSDNTVNEKITLTATFENTEVTQDITVANKTLDNIAILPPPTWPSALIGHPGDTTAGTDSWPGAVQLQWLFVSLVIGGVVKWKSRNPYMALATVVILLSTGWAINWVGDGMIVAAIIFVVYTSLSLTDVASGNLGRN